MTKKIKKQEKTYKRVDKEAPYSESVRTLILRGIERFTPLEAYRQYLAHKELDLNTRDSLLYRALNRDGVNLTSTQINFLNFFNSSKVSYYTYLQSRLLNIGAVSTAFMGRSLQSVSSNPALFAGDRYVFDAVLNGAHAGSKVFAGSVADLTVHGLKAVALFCDVYRKSSDTNKSLIKQTLLDFAEKNVIQVKVSAKDGKLNFSTPFVDAVRELALSMEKAMLNPSNTSRNNGTSGEQLYTSGMRGAIQVMTMGMESASIALDEKTVPSNDALSRVNESRDRIFNDIVVNDQSALWNYLFSVKSADVSCLEGTFDGSFANGGENGTINLPVLRRGQLTNLQLIEQFVTYLLLLGYGESQDLEEGLYTLFNVDAKTLQFNADSSKKDVVSVLYSKVEDISTTVKDKDGSYKTLSYDNAISSSYFGSFIYPAGSVILKGVTSLGDTGRATTSEIASNPTLTGLPAGVYVENDARNSTLCNPVSLLVFSVYEVLNLSQKDGSTQMDGTFNKETGIFKGKTDLSRESGDVAKTFSQVYNAMQVVLAGLSRFNSMTDNYSPYNYSMVRNAFKTLLTNLESATTTESALHLVSSFLSSDAAWNKSIASVIYSFYKASLMSNDNRIIENSADIVVNRIIFSYNKVVRPVSGQTAVSDFKFGLRLREEMNIRDVVITGTDTNILGYKEGGIASAFHSDNVKTVYQTLLTYLRANAGADRAIAIESVFGTELFRNHLNLAIYKETNNLLVYRRSLTTDSTIKLVDKYNLPTVVKDQVLQTLREIDSALASEFALVKDAVQQTVNVEVLTKMNLVLLFFEKYGELKGTLVSDGAYTEKVDKLIEELKKAMADLLLATDVDDSIIAMWNSACDKASAKGVVSRDYAIYKSLGMNLKTMIEALQSSLLRIVTIDNLKTWLTNTYDALREVAYRPQITKVPMETLNNVVDLLAVSNAKYNSGFTEVTGKEIDMTILKEKSKDLTAKLVDNAVDEVSNVFGDVNVSGYTVKFLNQISVSAVGAPKYEFFSGSKIKFQPDGEDLAWDFSKMTASESSGITTLLAQVTEHTIELKKREGMRLITEIAAETHNSFKYFSTLMTYCSKQFNPVSKMLAKEPIIVSAVSQQSLKEKVGDILGIGAETMYSRESAKALAEAILLHYRVYQADSVIKPTDLCASYAYDESLEGVKGGALFELTHIAKIQDFLTYSTVLWRFDEVIEQTTRRSSVLLNGPSRVEIAFAEEGLDGKPILQTLNYGQVATAREYFVERGQGFRSLTKAEAKSVDKEIILDMTNEVLDLII